MDMEGFLSKQRTSYRLGMRYRGAKTLKRLVGRLKKKGIKSYCIDDYQAYSKILPRKRSMRDIQGGNCSDRKG